MIKVKKRRSRTATVAVKVKRRSRVKTEARSQAQVIEPVVVDRQTALVPVRATSMVRVPCTDWYVEKTTVRKAAKSAVVGGVVVVAILHPVAVMVALVAGLCAWKLFDDIF